MPLQHGNRALGRHIGHTVLEIMTPVDELYLWADEPDAVVLEQARAAGITYLPVQRGGQIGGLARRDELRIAEHLPLTADWLIAADTPILHLIELFARQPERIFLILQ
jgi:hypothetical protein